MTRITGSFREWGGGSTDSYIGVQPFVRAVVELPRLDLKHPVDFLVDTGAARSTLHPQSMVRLGISLEIYVPTLISDMTGVGGGASYGEEEAVLHFRNAQVPMRILVGPLVKEQFNFSLSSRIPSLLGMDLLRMGRLSVDYLANELWLDMHRDEDLRHLQILQRKLSPAEYTRYRRGQREKS